MQPRFDLSVTSILEIRVQNSVNDLEFLISEGSSFQICEIMYEYESCRNNVSYFNIKVQTTAVSKIIARVFRTLKSLKLLSSMPKQVTVQIAFVPKYTVTYAIFKTVS